MNKVEFKHGLNAPRKQFADNIAINIKRNYVGRFQTQRAIIVGGGPSAGDYIEDIRDHQRKGWKVTAVNGAHDWLIRHEIRPDNCVLMDATEAVSTFIKRPHGGCTYYLASQAHPSLFEKLRNTNVVMWHAHLDEESNKFIEENEPGATIMSGANTVGLHAIALEYFKGTRKLKLYGFDSSHRPSGDHAYDNSQQLKTDEIEFVFKGERFLSTGTWAAQAEMFAPFWRQYFKLGMRIEVIGDGLLPAMARHEKETLFAELKGS